MCGEASAGSCRYKGCTKIERWIDRERKKEREREERL